MLKTYVAAAAVLAATAAMGQGKAELESVQRAVHVCASCHGDEGRSTNKLAPSLAGQMREYTIRQLKDFRDKKRSETDTQAYMWGISALLTDEQVEGLADYYSQQQPAKAKSTQPKLEAAGRVIFTQGMPDKGVRPCTQCHGDGGEGMSAFPRIAGLNADYVFRQLRAFKTPLRPHGIIMKQELQALSDAQLRAVAAYVASR